MILSNCKVQVSPSLMMFTLKTFIVILCLIRLGHFVKGQGPVINRPIRKTNINNIYRFNFTIPEDSFIDAEDGNTRKLNLIIYQPNGQPVPKSNWILLQSQNLLGVITKEVYDNQPPGGYKYYLAAIDKDGYETKMLLEIAIQSLAPEPFYYRRIQMYSRDNGMVYQYGDVEILFAFHNRMAGYLQVNANSFITKSFIIQRRSDQVNIIIEWSISTLTGNVCKPDEIIKLRNLLEGEALNAVKKLLAPAFVVTSTSEYFNGSCSYLSSALPEIGDRLSSKEVAVGTYFVYNLPANVFKTPQSSTMRLSLGLYYANNTRVAKSHWLKLEGEYTDQKPLRLYGFVALPRVLSYPSGQYRLVASTPLLQSAHQSFALTFSGIITAINYIVTLTHTGKFETVYSTFFTTVANYLASFLGLESSIVLILDLTVSTQNAILKFTLRNIPESPCNRLELERLTNLMFTNSGAVQNTLKSGLQSAVMFVASSGTVTYSGSCDPPKILSAIGSLKVAYGGRIQYPIPSNAYSDTRDGTSLQLTLLNSSGNLVPTYSWITLDHSNRMILAVPIDQDIADTKEFNFTLRVTNSGNASTDDHFIVRLIGTKPSWSVRFGTKLTHKLTTSKLSIILSEFVKKLGSFMSGANSDNVFIHKVTWDKGNELYLLWQNTSIGYSPCDFRGRIAMQRALQNKPGISSPPSVAFKGFLRPEFTVSEILYEEADPCTRSEPKPPYFNIKYLSMIATINVSPDEVSITDINQDLFKDEEDIDLQNMRLELFNAVGSAKVSKSYWIGLQQKPRRLISIPTDLAYEETASNTVVKVGLRAYDSTDMDAEIKIGRRLLPSAAKPYYNVTMEFQVSGIANEPYSVQLLYLKEKLDLIIGSITKIYVRSYTMKSISGLDGTSILVWSPMALTGKCNFTLIRALREIMFQPRTTIFQNDLNRRMGSNFLIRNITDTVSGPCSLNPPVVNILLPTLKVSFCGIFSYQIPKNAYSDTEDGQTRDLHLRLLESNGKEISPEKWITFNESRASQTVNIFLTSKEADVSYPRTHTFLLVARDSSGLTTNQSLNIEIIGQAPEVSYTMELEAEVSQPGLNHFYILARKVMNFMGDRNNSFWGSSYRTTVNGKSVFVWGNCSLRYNPCDVNAIIKIREVLKSEDGLWKPEFLNALHPEFKEPFVLEKLLGPCKNDKKPRAVTPFGPLIVTSCKTFKFKIPSSTFFDDEQGNTEYLRLSLSSLNGPPIDNSFWVTLDAMSQSIVIVGSETVASSLQNRKITLILTASDYIKQSAQQTLVIEFQKDSPALTQVVTMDARVAATLTTKNYVTRWDELRKSILNYAKDSSQSAVQFIELPTKVDPNIPVRIVWSNCSISRSTCENEKVMYFKNLLKQGADVNPNLRVSLLPRFNVLSLSFEIQGACKDQISPPSVLQPIGTLLLSYCRHLEYKIPENVFYDKIDGNTRKLKLAMTNVNGSAIGENDIVYFDSTEQKLVAVLYDNFFDSTRLTVPLSFQYRLTATTKRGLSVHTDFTLIANETHTNKSLYIVTSVFWKGGPPHSLARVMSQFAKKLDMYFPTNGIHFKEISRTPAVKIFYRVTFTSCSLSYLKCDLKLVNQVENMTSNSLGPVQGFVKAMLPDFDVSTATTNRRHVCKVKDSYPSIAFPIKNMIVHRCQRFNNPNIGLSFLDEEDGSNLHLSITTINGRSISLTEKHWVYILPTSRELLGVVTDEVVTNYPSKGYNITVRATDSKSQFVETSFLLQIIGLPPKHLYTISMNLQANFDKNLEIVDQNILVAIINDEFFRENITNVLSFVRNENQIKFSWSVCTLSEKCNEIEFTNILQRLVSGNNPTKEIQRALSPRFVINSLKHERVSYCRGPLNPPIPKFSSINRKLSFCGGFEYPLPLDIFVDPEDGNIKNLQLMLVDDNNKNMDGEVWIRLDSQGQKLYGFPTQDEILSKISKLKYLKLIAKDKSGLEASIQLNLSYSRTQDPKYYYSFKYTPVNKNELSIDERLAFGKVVSSYLGDKTAANFGLVKIMPQNNNAKLLTYGNCSVQYNPCDLAALRQIKTMLLQANTLPTKGLSNAASGMFLINYGYTSKKMECSGTVPHPPYVTRKLSQINITICTDFSLKISNNTFYDLEDGVTWNMKVTLLKGSQEVSKRSWLYLSTNKHTLSAVGSAFAALSQPTQGYVYQLTVTDSTKLSASTPLHIRINGPASLLRDCKIETKFKVSTTVSAMDTTSFVSHIRNRMSQYFSVSKDLIGLVDCKWESTTDVIFSWSLCPNTAVSQSPNKDELRVYHFNLITKILMKLFESDRKTIKQTFYVAFGDGITITQTRTVFTGYCNNLPPVLSPNYSALTVEVSTAGYRLIDISNNWFYDYEQGGTRSLLMNITTENKIVIRNDYWISIDVSLNTVLIFMTETARKSAKSEFIYYFMVTDRWGETAYMKIIIAKRPPFVSTQYLYRITYEIIYTTATSYSSQIVFFFQKLSIYYGININSVVIISVTTGRGIPAYRIITWTVIPPQTCSSQVLSKVKSSFTVSKGLSTELRDTYKPRAIVKRIYYFSTCSPPVNPPSTTFSIIRQNITFCSFYTYQLPFSAFADRVNGDARSIKLQFYDETGNEVKLSSWLQLNTANLSLYGFSIASYGFKTHTFSVTGTNSGGLKTSFQFQARMRDYPYTSDCNVTLSVKRHFGPTNMANVDVLWNLATMISTYYGDTGPMIKILEFTKMENDQYRLVYSNCTFQFDSKQKALRGLHESYRQTIQNLFSKIVTSNQIVNPLFRSSLLPKFSVVSITASYSCIEKPPTSGKTTELTSYAYNCQEYTDYISKTLFYDERDGGTRNLHLSLHFLNGEEVSNNEWIHLDKKQQMVYGVVNDKVKQAASTSAMRYILRATDSSGRSADVGYNVQLVDPRPFYDVKFIIGFSSKLNVNEPVASILRDITRKIAKYIDPSDVQTKLYVYEYIAPSSLKFSYCPLKCTNAQMKAILPKLQEVMFKTTPNINFLNALKPEFNLYYVYADGPKCVENIDIKIINPTPPSINVTQCGSFEFTIPAKTFMIDSRLEIRNMYLSLTNMAGAGLGLKSWLFMDSTLQTLYGIPVLSQLSQTLTYKLHGNHPQSSRTATTNLKIRFNEEVSKQDLTDKCALKINVTYSLTNSYPMYFIMKTLMEKISMFVGDTTHQYKVLDFTQTSGSHLTVVWTNCSWQSIKDKTSETIRREIKTVLSKLFHSYPSTTYLFSQAFAKHLLPEFTIMNLSYNGECNSTDPGPPTVDVQPGVVEAKCGELNYRIPENTFKEGTRNTRQLSLQLYQQDGSALPVSSWLYLDTQSQTIMGLPNKVVLDAQPKGGYRYRLEATSSSSGLSVFTEIRVNISGTFGKPAAFLSLIGQIKKTFTYDVQNVLFLTRKIASSAFANDERDRLYIYDPQQFNPIVFALNIANCSTCDLTANLILQNIGNSQEKLKNLLAPDIDVKNSLLNLDESVCDETIVKEVGGGPLKAKFCQRYEKDILELLGNPIPTGYVAEIRSRTNKQLPDDSWYWFNSSNNKMYGFPSKSDYEAQGLMGSLFIYLVKNVNTNSVLGIKYYKYLKIIEPLPNEGLRFSLTFSTRASQSFINAHFIQSIWDDLVSALGRSDIQTISVSRDQTAGALNFIYTFELCNLPKQCDSNEVVQVINVVFKDGKSVKQEFRDKFQSSFNLVKATVDCSSKVDNKTTSANISMTTHPCRVNKISLKKQILDTFGKETITKAVLKFASGIEVPLSSWIWLNETSYEVIALPPSSVTNAYLPNGFSFQVLLESQSGKTSSLPLQVFTKQRGQLYYKFITSFISYLPASTPYVVIQQHFISLIQKFLQTNSTFDSEIIDFDLVNQASNTFYFRWGLCSIQELICKDRDKSLQQEHSILLGAQNKPSTKLYNYAITDFKIEAFNIEKHYQINNPPKTVITSRRIEVSRCEYLQVKDLASMFYDAQQGNVERLSLQLAYPDGTQVPSSSWISLYNGTLYIVPHEGVQAKTYNYLLYAMDSCNQKVKADLIVKVIENALIHSYQTKLTGTTLISDKMPDAYLLVHTMSKLCIYLSLQQCTQRIVQYTRKGNELMLRLDYCIPQPHHCNESFISELQSKLGIKEKEIRVEVKNAFNGILNISELQEKNSQNCSVNNNTLTTKVSFVDLNVSICNSKGVQYHVPSDLFLNKNQEISERVKLSLLTHEMVSLASNSWLKLNQSSRMIHGIPRISELQLLDNETYRYTLLGTDRYGNSASIKLRIYSLQKIPKETFKFKIHGRITGQQNHGSHVEKTFSQILSEHVYVENGWSVVEYSVNKDNPNNFELTVGLCQEVKVCNCTMFAEIHDKISKISTLQSLKESNIDITKVETISRGPCDMQKSPQTVVDWNELDVVVGKPTTFSIPRNKFHDLEEGKMENLTVQLVDSSGNKMTEHDWMRLNLDDFSICALVFWNRKIGITTSHMYQMKMTAADKCGVTAVDSFVTHFVYTVSRLIYFLTLQISHIHSTHFLNCSHMDKLLTQLYNYTLLRNNSIFLVDYTSHNLTDNMTIVVGFDLDCSNASVSKFRERFLDEKDVLLPSFVDSLSPEFLLLEAYDNGTKGCEISVPVTQPTTGPPIVTTKWWILIILLVIFFLILSLFFIWICCPRCCYKDRKLVGPRISLYQDCCFPGGRFASYKPPKVVSPSPYKKRRPTLILPSPPPSYVPSSPSISDGKINRGFTSDEDSPDGKESLSGISSDSVRLMIRSPPPDFIVPPLYGSIRKKSSSETKITDTEIYKGDIKVDIDYSQNISVEENSSKRTENSTLNNVEIRNTESTEMTTTITTNVVNQSSVIENRLDQETEFNSTYMSINSEDASVTNTNFILPALPLIEPGDNDRVGLPVPIGSPLLVPPENSTDFRRNPVLSNGYQSEDDSVYRSRNPDLTDYDNTPTLRIPDLERSQSIQNLQRSYRRSTRSRRVSRNEERSSRRARSLSLVRSSGRQQQSVRGQYDQMQSVSRRRRSLSNPRRLDSDDDNTENQSTDYADNIPRGERNQRDRRRQSSRRSRSSRSLERSYGEPSSETEYFSRGNERGRRSRRETQSSSRRRSERGQRTVSASERYQRGFRSGGTINLRNERTMYDRAEFDDSYV